MQQLSAVKVFDPRPATAGPFRTFGMLRRAEMRLERIARRRWLSCLIVVLLALGMRAALLPVLPVPYTPYTQDEFAYLLGGETFALGRLANPPHPMRQFFATPMENMDPTYVSKYPPGQAAFLALGIRLFGHPWFGVWLSVGLLCGALCWMLQGWLPPKYGIIGGILATMQFAVAGYWMNSYWGGAVAALGGALAIGALPRLVRRPTAGATVAASAAILVLANTRPFEGAIFVSLWSVALLWWARRLGNLAKLFRAVVIVPLVAGIVATAAFTAYYDWRTTGNPLLMPYVVNSREYHYSPNLWILPAASPPLQFRDSAMRAQWNWDYDIHTKAQQDPLRVVHSMAHAVFSTFVDGAGVALIPFVSAGLLLISSFRARMVACLLTTFVCSLLFEQYIQAHYIAPALGLMVLAAMYGVRLFRIMKVRGRAIGLSFIAVMLAFSAALFIDNTVTYIADIRNAPLSPPKFRARVLAQLTTKPGRHLVMVRYGAAHDPRSEHVYNDADIDSQKVVWALDRGPVEDRALFAYYPDRVVWLYQPDGPTPSIVPWR